MSKKENAANTQNVAQANETAAQNAAKANETAAQNAPQQEAKKATIEVSKSDFDNLVKQVKELKQKASKVQNFSLIQAHEWINERAEIVKKKNKLEQFLDQAIGINEVLDHILAGEDIDPPVVSIGILKFKNPIVVQKMLNVAIDEAQNLHSKYEEEIKRLENPFSY